MAQATRVIADCRQIPDNKNCSVTIAGTEDEVLRITVRHAGEEHGHKDTPELRKMIKSKLRPE